MPKPQKRKKNFSKDKKIHLKKKKPTSFLQKNIKTAGRPNFNIMSRSFSKQNYFRNDISLFPNNVFCSFKDIGKNKLLSSCSGGKYKLKISKKSLKYASKIVITNFFKELKQKRVTFSKPLVVSLVAPSNLRKRIGNNVFALLKYVKHKRLAFYATPKKLFNGCRAKKQIRKKHKRYAIYK